MFALRSGKYIVFASRALMPPRLAKLARAQFAVTRWAMNQDSANVQKPPNELPSGHIVKFVEVHPSLKHLVKGPHGKKLQTLQESTYTSISEKLDGFEASGIPYDIERFETEVRQLPGEPVPTEWMQEYEDLVNADVLLRPKPETRKDEEEAERTKPSGPVNHYFFLARTKAMCGLLNKIIQVNNLQEETNAKITFDKKQPQIVVRIEGREAEVRNAFCKLLTTVRANTQYAAIRLDLLKNQVTQARVQTGYWRVKTQLLDGTCVDRSFKQSRIEGMERHMKELEAKAQRLQLEQRLSDQSIPEAQLMRGLYDPIIEEAKAQLRAMEAKAEESKQRYEEAVKTAKDGPESNAGPDHEDLSNSTKPTTIRACTQYAAIKLEVLRNRIPQAGVQTAYWRAQLELLKGTCVDQSAKERRIEGMERCMKDLEAKAQRLQLEQGPSEQSAREAALVKELHDPKIEETTAQLRAMEAKAEESKQRYEEAMKAPKGDLESTGIPRNMERIKTRIQQLPGHPVPMEWMREYEDLVDANVLCRPGLGTVEDKEDAGSAESSTAVYRYFFLASTKAMCDLLNQFFKLGILQKETNVKVAYQTRRGKIGVRIIGQEADVRNAFCKLLTTVRAYAQYPALQLKDLKNQTQRAILQLRYWRAKALLLDGTCDRSATESKIERIERSMKDLEANAQGLQLGQQVSEQSSPEVALVTKLCGSKIDEAKTELRVMEAKAEKSKQRYEEAMKTAKDDADGNDKSPKEGLPCSAKLTTVRTYTQHPAVQLKVLRNRIALADTQRAYWRAKTRLLEGTCVHRSSTERRIKSMERYMKHLELKARRLQLGQRQFDQSIPAAASTRDIEEAKAQVHAVEEKAEESKKRYEEAMKTVKDDPESNAKPGQA